MEHFNRRKYGTVFLVDFAIYAENGKLSSYMRSNLPLGSITATCVLLKCFLNNTWSSLVQGGWLLQLGIPSNNKQGRFDSTYV